MNYALHIVSFLLLYFLTSPFAISEETKSIPDKKYSVFYTVENLIKKEKMIQEYEFEIYSKPEPHYKLRVKNVTTRNVISTEVQAEWNKVTITPGYEHYTDLGLTENISDIDEDTRFFGRLEIKSIHDHKILKAWPVFGTVEKRKELYVSTLTAHVEEGGELVITDVYGKNLYHIPVYKRSIFRNKDGKVMSDMQFTLM